MITTDVAELVADPGTDGVLVCSAQHQHFDHIRMAIEAGKPVFVEKPLVTTADDLGALLRLVDEHAPLITLGLNRRYSPKLQELRGSVPGPIDCVQYLITQPFVPADHWTLDPIEGGGRLITEGEHFIDLCNLLIGKTPISVTARALGEMPDDIRTLCNWSATLDYEGATAHILFHESGAPGFPRERVTVFSKGHIGVLDDFGKLTIHGPKARRGGTGLRKSMGHAEELDEFVKAIRGEPNRVLDWETASLATVTMFAAQESIRIGAEIDVAAYRSALMTPDAGKDEPHDD
jgi:predicted dehydrogenase